MSIFLKNVNFHVNFPKIDIILMSIFQRDVNFIVSFQMRCPC